MKDEDIHLKYLAVNKNDLLWGLAVNSTGFQDVGRGKPYPPTGHPSRYLFSEERGRILNEYQVLYITEGQGVFRSASLSAPVHITSGTMFVLFPGEWHTYRPDPSTGWKEYWIGFEGPLAHDIAEKGFISPERPVFRLGLHDEIVNLYEEAIQVASDQASGFQQRLMGIVVHLMGLAVYYNRQQVFSQVGDLINRAKIIISRQYDTIRPEDVARLLSMGYSNFRKVFKEYTGFSPAKYIQDVRFARVKEILTNSTLPVKQIAYDNGFENYDYFFTAFRRITGMTPLAYRELTQGRKR